LVGPSHSLIVGTQTGAFPRPANNAREWNAWQKRSGTRQPDPRTILVAGDGVRGEKAARLEAALFVAEGPLSIRKLCQYALLADIAETKSQIEELNSAYDADGSAFRIERVASGYQLLTRPQLAYWLDQLHQRQAELKLSPPALETLTIIAYRQPITRADIESVRGVMCAEIIKHLMDRGLVKIGGEDDSLGRPYLYVTTKFFLESFGLRTLNDLPNALELRRKPDEESEDDDDTEVAESVIDEESDSDEEEDAEEEAQDFAA
jgi:segregation and condensation protein B